MKSTQDPQSLLGLLHRVALLCTLLILAFAGSGIYWVYERYIVSNAESEAVSISESIVALEKNLLLHPRAEGGAQLVVDPSKMSELDRTLKKFLVPYGILKIKVFAPTGEVVYSTDPDIIGEQNPRNERLAVALAGRNDSQLQTKEEVYDLRNERRFDVDVVETYVPIRNEEGAVVGSFEIYQDTTQYRRETYMGVLLSVSILAAILMVVFAIAYLFLRTAVNRLTQAQDKLQELATLDGLTGLLNHREVMRLGENEFARYVRQHNDGSRIPFSLIMADLDNFKLINDSHGHLDGDEVLRVVAARINDQMRRYSIVGRYGGEEFLLILPEADENEVRAIAERIRCAIEARPIALAKQPVEVTLSLGVATVDDQDEAFEEVLLRADKALYRAKEAGKNRVGGVDQPQAS